MLTTLVGAILIYLFLQAVVLALVIGGQRDRVDAHSARIDSADAAIALADTSALRALDAARAAHGAVPDSVPGFDALGRKLYQLDGKVDILGEKALADAKLFADFGRRLALLERNSADMGERIDLIATSAQDVRDEVIAVAATSLRVAAATLDNDWSAVPGTDEPSATGAAAAANLEAEAALADRIMCG